MIIGVGFRTKLLKEHCFDKQIWKIVKLLLIFVLYVKCPVFLNKSPVWNVLPFCQSRWITALNISPSRNRSGIWNCCYILFPTDDATKYKSFERVRGSSKHKIGEFLDSLFIYLFIHLTPWNENIHIACVTAVTHWKDMIMQDTFWIKYSMKRRRFTFTRVHVYRTTLCIGQYYTTSHILWYSDRLHNDTSAGSRIV